jgi:hypothetical protein
MKKIQTNNIGFSCGILGFIGGLFAIGRKELLEHILYIRNRDEKRQ